MASIKLSLDTRTKKKGTDLYPLKIFLNHNSNTRSLKMRTKLYCKESQWNGTGVNRTFPNSKRINNNLEKEVSEANKVIVDNEERLNVMTVNEVKELIEKTRFGNQSSTKLKLQEWQLIYCERCSEGTKKWYKESVSPIINFNNGNDIEIEKINVKFLKEFEADHIARGGSQNGVAAYFRGVKSLINKAIAEYDEIEKNVFDNYKITQKKTTKRALGIDLFNDLRKLKNEGGDSLSTADINTLNYCLFMFNCRGMNFVDLAKLKKGQIWEAKYENGQLVSGKLFYKRSKNKKDFLMALTLEAISILNEYDITNSENDDFVFPIGYEEGSTGYERYRQKRKRFNTRLRKLAALSGHPGVSITSYSIRHSWASIAKGKGVSSDKIGEMMGHDDPKVTQVYLESFGNQELDEANEMIVA